MEPEVHNGFQLGTKSLNRKIDIQKPVLKQAAPVKEK